MTELINSNINTEIEFKSKALTNYTKKIGKCFADAKNSLFKVAVLLNEVNEKQAFKNDFKNITEYAETVFGMKKTATYNFIKIGKNYTNEDFTCTLPHKTEENYSLTQVVEMLPLEKDNKIIEVSEAEIITPDMTTKEIRKIVKELTKKPTEETTEETEETTEEVKDTSKEVAEILNEMEAYAYDISVLLENKEVLKFFNEFKEKVNNIK